MQSSYTIPKRLNLNEILFADGSSARSSKTAEDDFHAKKKLRVGDDTKLEKDCSISGNLSVGGSVSFNNVDLPDSSKNYIDSQISKVYTLIGWNNSIAKWKYTLLTQDEVSGTDTLDYRLRHIGEDYYTKHEVDTIFGEYSLSLIYYDGVSSIYPSCSGPTTATPSSNNFVIGGGSTTKFQIKNSTSGVGKVLTCTDVNGTAEWQTVTASSTVNNITSANGTTNSPSFYVRDIPTSAIQFLPDAAGGSYTINQTHDSTMLFYSPLNFGTITTSETNRPAGIRMGGRNADGVLELYGGWAFDAYNSQMWNKSGSNYLGTYAGQMMRFDTNGIQILTEINKPLTIYGAVKIIQKDVGYPSYNYNNLTAPVTFQVGEVSKPGTMTLYGTFTSSGKITAPYLQFTSSPVNGYVMTSDGAGNCTWQPPASSTTISSFTNDVTFSGNITVQDTALFYQPITISNFFTYPELILNRSTDIFSKITQGASHLYIDHRDSLAPSTTSIALRIYNPTTSQYVTPLSVYRDKCSITTLDFTNVSTTAMKNSVNERGFYLDNSDFVFQTLPSSFFPPSDIGHDEKWSKNFTSENSGDIFYGTITISNNYTRTITINIPIEFEFVFSYVTALTKNKGDTFNNWGNFTHTLFIGNSTSRTSLDFYDTGTYKYKHYLASGSPNLPSGIVWKVRFGITQASFPVQPSHFLYPASTSSTEKTFNLYLRTTWSSLSSYGDIQKYYNELSGIRYYSNFYGTFNYDANRTQVGTVTENLTPGVNDVFTPYSSTTQSAYIADYPYIGNPLTSVFYTSSSSVAMIHVPFRGNNLSFTTTQTMCFNDVMTNYLRCMNPIEVQGTYCRRGPNSPPITNFFNTYWNASDSKLEFWIDSTLVNQIALNSSLCDHRIKHKISPIRSSVLDRLCSLEMFEYEIKDHPPFKSDGTRIGYFAHDLQEQFEEIPSLVHGKKDDIDENGEIIAQQVSTDVINLTIRAIQELREENHQLKHELNKLNHYINELQQTVNVLSHHLNHTNPAPYLYHK